MGGCRGLVTCSRAVRTYHSCVSCKSMWEYRSKSRIEASSNIYIDIAISELIIHALKTSETFIRHIHIQLFLSNKEPSCMYMQLEP